MTDSAVVPLSVRSCFSLLEGASTIPELCRAAQAGGFSGFALTDTNGLYGLPAYVVACEHYGLRPVVGVQLIGGGARALLLPRSQAGYAALCRAISARHREGAALDLAETLLDGSDLAVVSDDAALLERLRAEGHDDLFAELRHGRQPKLERLARRLELPLVATCEVAFARPDDWQRHRVLQAIAQKRTLGRLDESRLASQDAWLQPAATLGERYWGEVGQEALLRAAELAEACRFGGRDWGYGVLTFPHWEGGEAAQVLRVAAREGARRRYRVPAGARLPARVEQRLERELDLVVRKGFADYFLIVRDIVRDSERTCGRGSAAASIIAYALGITHVDPVRHDLFFERFLNEGRVHPPDIDIDFPWDERDDVLASVFARFGPRAAMVANHVCFRPRAALREVARSYGLVEHEIAGLTSRLPYFTRGSIGAMLETHPLTQGVQLSPPWDDIVRLASEISGLPRHLSVHPGGVVITPGPISDLVPVQRAPKGVPIIQWEKDGTEEAGLVKIDLLGNRSLAVIRDALAAARAHGHDPPTYAELDVIDDERCQQLLARGETMGCFYVESPSMRLLQQRSGRGDFEHLVIHSSIIRPAANEFIREYLRRLHGEPWEPLHPELERILEGTLGLMAYQEDLARIAIALAGFSPREADRLRKVLAKKERDLRLSDLEERFRAGARARDLPEELITKVWGMCASFAGYSFCKSHSASYALVSFKCCYLRDRFPAEFLAGVISNGGGYYSTLGYLGEARRLGLTILPACVNASEWAWTGRERELRVGLCQLRGLRVVAAEALLDARAAGGPFADFEDLVRRVPALHRDELATLARAGALSALGESNRARLHWRVALLARRAGAGSLFQDTQPTCPASPDVDDLDPDRLLEQELLAYGLPITVHPLALWSPAIDEVDVVPANEIPQHIGRRVKVIGWRVTAKLVRTKHSEPMEFTVLEDPTGVVDVTVFPRVYRRGAQALHASRPIVVTGRVEQEHGVAQVVAERIRSWWGPCRIEEPEFGDADRVGEDLLD